jgi:iron complex outermembrane receptor protein
MKRFGVPLVLFLGIGSTTCRQAVFAQEHTGPRDTVYLLPPVVVTATQARERESPVTFTNLTAAQIRDRYSMQDVPVLLSELPSMTTYSENGNGIGYNYVNLRGFDQRRISVMVNGIPQNDPEDHNVYWIDFPDLLASTDLIQVQRGAGSDFYGPAAIGGSINLITDPFAGMPGITLESDMGFQQYADSSRSFPLISKKFGATFTSGPVDGRYRFYGRLGTITSDGYRQGAWVNLGSYFFGAMRIDPSMTTRVHFYGGPLQDGLAYYGLPKFANSDPVLRRQNLAAWEATPDGMQYASITYRRPQETESFSQPHYELLHDWKLSPNLTLHNTLFYYSGEGYFDYDASWADTTMLRLGSAYGIPTATTPSNTIVRGYVGNHQWGWLPRVDINHGNGLLTLGAEFRFHRSTHWGRIVYAENLPANFNPDYHFYEYNGVRNIVSLYGNDLYHWTDAMTVEGSVQAVWNSYGLRNEKFLGNTFTVPYFFVNPRFGVNYNVSDATSAHISVAYTSREPTMRDLYAAEDAYFGATPEFAADTTGGTVRYDFSRPIAQPEQLFDIELGVRYSSENLLAGLNFYWMGFTNELVKSGRVDIFGQPVTGNAERSRHTGLELDGAVNLLPRVKLSGNATFSSNRLVHYKMVGDDGLMHTLDGNPIAGFPDILGNLRLTYRDSALTGSFVVKYVGPFYTDNFKNAANRNDAYTVCNVELVYHLQVARDVSLDLRGEVRNVFDILYTMSGEGNAFFPAAERNAVFGVRLKI